MCAVRDRTRNADYSRCYCVFSATTAKDCTKWIAVLSPFSHFSHFSLSPLLSSLVLVLVLALVLVLFFFLGLLGLRAHRVCFDFVDLLSWNPAHHEGRHGWQSPCCKLILLGCFVVSLSECVI